MPRRFSATFDFLLIFAFAAALIWPLFQLTHTASWGSMEGTLIADARFLAENWPHPLWQPLWYGGTRFDLLYPPALRYGTAALLKMFPALEPARAYHLYTAFTYCLGIATVYALVRTVNGSRRGAWGAALASAFTSPSFLLLHNLRAESFHFTPQRLSVLVRHGEGLHITALAWLPLALAASYVAMREGRPAMLALAALACAMVASSNFYGATSLAVWFPVLVWSLWITHLERAVLARAAVIVVLAYGLTAFWLTPDYFAVTWENLRLVSEQGNRWARWLLVACGVLFLMGSDRWAKGRRELVYPVFVCGAAVFFAASIAGNRFLNFQVVGEAVRLVPEFDLALTMGGVFLIQKLWNGGAGRKAAAVALIAALAPMAAAFTRYSRQVYPREPHPQERIQYQIPAWIDAHLRGARVLASGTIRYWYNTWFDGAQLGGGSEQGVLNPAVRQAYFGVIHSSQVEEAIRWMQSFGVDAVIVHEGQSAEPYKDSSNAGIYRGVLEVIHDNGKGDRIYGVPRRWRWPARVIDRRKADALVGQRAILEAYAELVENGPDSPAVAEWMGTDEMRIQAAVREGEALLVQVSFDPAWRAYSGAQRLPIQKDLLGQMRINAPPGSHQIRLVFALPAQNLAGWMIFAVTVCIVGWMLARWR